MDPGGALASVPGPNGTSVNLGKAAPKLVLEGIVCGLNCQMNSGGHFAEFLGLGLTCDLCSVYCCLIPRLMHANFFHQRCVHQCLPFQKQSFQEARQIAEAVRSQVL